MIITFQLISIRKLYNNIYMYLEERFNEERLRKQKQNQDIYVAYSMINLLTYDLKSYRETVNERLKPWYSFVTVVARLVDIQPFLPWVVKRCSRFRCNEENFDSIYLIITNPYIYNNRYIFPDNIISQFNYRLKHYPLVFVIVSPVIHFKTYSIDETVEALWKGLKMKW